MKNTQKKLLSLILVASLASNTIPINAGIFDIFKRRPAPLTFKTRLMIAVGYWTLAIATIAFISFLERRRPVPHYPPYVPPPPPGPTETTEQPAQPITQVFTDIFEALDTRSLPHVRKAVEEDRVDITKTNNTGLSALDVALSRNQEKIAEYLITKDTPIFDDITDHLYNHLARSAQGSLNIVTHLVESGADIHRLDEDNTYAHVPHFPLRTLTATALERAFLKRNPGIIQYLMEKNGRIRSDNVNSFLDSECSRLNGTGSLEIVKLLLQLGAQHKRQIGSRSLDQIAQDHANNQIADYLITVDETSTNIQALIDEYDKISNETDAIYKSLKESFITEDQETLTEIITRAREAQKHKLQSCDFVNRLKNIIKIEETINKSENNDTDATEEEGEEDDGEKEKNIASIDIQFAIELLVKIHKKLPNSVDKDYIKVLFKEITFNDGLFKCYQNPKAPEQRNLNPWWTAPIERRTNYDYDYFPELRKFAANQNVTDRFGETVINACKRYCTEEKIIEDLVSINFRQNPNYYRMPKNQLLEQSRNRNSTFDKMLNQMIYANQTIGQGNWRDEKVKYIVPEISAHIASYLDGQTLNGIVRQLPRGTTHKISNTTDDRNNRHNGNYDDLFFDDKVI